MPDDLIRALPQPRLAAAQAIAGAPLRWPLSWIEEKFRAARLERLDVQLPSGRRIELGAGGGQAVELRIVRWRALYAVMRRGALGFAEAFMDGDAATDDLVALFEYFMRNEAALLRIFPRLNDTRLRDRIHHLRRPNTPRGSRRNISAHYDLGNEFYRTWLDATMLYSSGIYRHGAASLEEAQQAKLDAILAALDLGPQSRVLEIGCGWGAVAIAAARRGADVRAITISAEQEAWARAAVAAAGVSNCADIAFEDYRATGGTYDRIVSIEMIEAVGEANWPRYFETLYERLAPGGHAVIQAITIAPQFFDRYRQNPDFIQRYVFPGGMLPTVVHIRDGSERAGLAFEVVEEFGASYAQTLIHWRARFEAAWPAIAKLGYDERFRRLWLFYLAYCEVGFRHGTVDVGLYKLSKPVQSRGGAS